MRLPPYGSSIDKSNRLVWIWAGDKQSIYKRVKVWGDNTCAFFSYDDPRNYHWPVAGRNVIIVSSMAALSAQDLVIKRLVRTLLNSNATNVAEIYWSPNREVLGEASLIITHYKRN